MAKELNKAQVNHLRRLLGWIRCEYFMTPEEIVRVVNEHRATLGEPSAEGKARLVEWHEEAKRVPLYVRAAIKSLEPVVKEAQGEIVDAGGAGLPGKCRSRTKPQVKKFPPIAGAKLLTVGKPEWKPDDK